MLAVETPPLNILDNSVNKDCHLPKIRILITEEAFFCIPLMPPSIIDCLSRQTRVSLNGPETAISKKTLCGVRDIRTSLPVNFDDNMANFEDAVANAPDVLAALETAAKEQR
jgi:hypothetical protein